MTSISSQSNFGKARKQFPGIHVNSLEICTKVGKGWRRYHENIWKTAANRSMPSPQNSLQFSKVLLFWPTSSPVTQYVKYTLHDSIKKLFILMYIQTMTKWISWRNSQLWRNSNFCNASLILSYTFPKRFSAPLKNLKRGQTWFEIPVVNLSDWNNYIFSPKNALFWCPFAIGALWLWCNCPVLFLCPDSYIDSKGITVPSPIARFLIMDHGLSSNSEKLPNFHFA